MTNTPDRIQRIRVFLLLVAFAAGVYMLTYRAAIQSGDTRRALDAVTSSVRYGDWLMDETNWIKLPFRIRASAALPLGEYRVQERLNILLAGPLLRIADALPRLGNIHTVWLFNVIVTSLNVGLVYLILRAMSYADAVAVAVAVGAGIGTNFWAYSQTFFREPLTAFFLLASLLVLQLGQGKGAVGRAASLAVAAIAMLLAYQTKYSAVFALPAIAVYALPPWRPGNVRSLRAAVHALLALLLLGLCFLMLVEPLPAALQDLLRGLGFSTDFLGTALRAYILSPGASIWATSPLTLLAIPGCVMLWRDGRKRFALSVLLFCVGYVLGHALLAGAHWFGGLSWPPRFLLPCIPVLMLATAPITQAMLHDRGRRLRLLWVALLCYGLWIQFIGVSLSLSRYGESLPPESNGLSEWAPALTQPRYFRWFVLPGRWEEVGFEFLWTRANLPLWGISFAAYTALVAAALLNNLRGPGGRWRDLSPILALLCLPLILLNLQSAYEKDPLTQSGQRALHQALDFLAGNARPDDVLLLPGGDYGNFILNHMDSTRPRAIILERPLAQAPSDRQPAAIISQNPNDWFDVQSFRILQQLAGQLDRLWVLAETSPFMRWSFRPLERYLAQHYYPLREVQLAEADPTVRLLEYSTRSPAPDPFAYYAGDIATDLRYGENIQLQGLVLPNGFRYRAGEAIELSLLWQADAIPAQDYTIAWFIVDSSAEQPVLQGRDAGPQDGFAPTSSWKPGWPVWDNRALRLPVNMRPGEYKIWLLMYRYDSGSGQIARLPVSGALVAEDATVGVLPITIAVD
ncbi:MAG: hypothetical protein OXN88_09360 [Chloroflexota bacterium]|nr:hypothetical protein [Chloroflexota bacterium]